MAQAVLEALRNLQEGKASTDDDERGIGGDESGAEAFSREIFTDYKPHSISRGVPHPGSIAEGTSLSAIKLPQTSYPLFDSIPDDIVAAGKLSQLQLESVLHACTKHQTFLPSGERAGFVLGDGAGVGKGRQIAGLILDNYARGRRRAVWLSTSSDLHHDAERDLRALGLHIPVINNLQTLDRETRVSGLGKDFQEGVLFMTYSTLIGGNGKGKTRLQQVIDWVGGADFSGPLVFDECHKAKNFVPGKEAQSTKVAAAVLEIQRLLPRARVMYCSATGVSEVQNMAYLTRVGLWGPGSAFATFEQFLDSMKRRGVTFLEMLSMEMKAEGYYVARGLSFRDAEFMELHCKLTPEQEAVYNASVELWQDLRQKLVLALDMTNTTSREVWKPFWSAQQRFFKLLCISMKVPTIIKRAKQALADGCAVVVGLQTTGEAAADALGLEHGQNCGFVSTTREMLHRFVLVHFPTHCMPNPSDGPVPEGFLGEEEPSSVLAKEALLKRIEDLPLPANFLDEIVDQLGGPKCVAEMTGRKGRVVRDARGRGVYELRAKPDSRDMDSLNVKETALFMAGKKLVAIISDAASTGISLHASAEVANQRRRIHLTIELPWSADKAIQQLGRSHRSNQTSAPKFELVVTNLGGEKRFAAAVARRLQSLGALTRGDRRAASGIDLSESNLDSPLGRKSLKRMYDCIVMESPSLPPGVSLPAVLDGCDEAEVAEVLSAIPDPEHITPEAVSATVQAMHVRMRDCVDLMGVGISMPRNDTVAEETSAAIAANAGSPKDTGDVRRFLNRLLGVPVARQNLLFNYFVCTVAAEVKAAKEEGRYSEGVSDLPVSDILEPPPPQVVWTDHYTGLQTLRTDLVTDRGLSFEAAARKLEHERVPGDRSGFYLSRRPMFGRNMCILALQRAGKGNLFDICRPNTGPSFFDMELDDLRQKYRMVDPQNAKVVWEEVFEASKDRCMHGSNCAQGAECTVGKRLVQASILSGSIVRVWGALEMVLQRHEHMLNKADRTMRVVRVEFASGHRLIGVRYPAVLLPEVVACLSTAQQLMVPVAALAPSGEAGQLTGAVLEAAAMGAGGAVRSEPVSPVNTKSAARAFRAPRTMLNFFKPLQKEGSPQVAVGTAADRATDQAADASHPHKPVGIASFVTTKAGKVSSKPQNNAPIDLVSDDEAGDARHREDLEQRKARASMPEAHVLACGMAEANGYAADEAGSAGGSSRGTEATPSEANGGMNGTHDPASHREQPQECKLRSIADVGGPAVAAAESRKRALMSDGKEEQGVDPVLVKQEANGHSNRPLRDSQGRLNAAAALGERHISGDSLALQGGSKKAKTRVGVLNEMDVESLLALGFSQDQAVRALKVTQGNVERAANWILSGM